MDHVRGYSMIKQKKSSIIFVVIFFLFWLVASYAQSGLSDFLQNLVKIEQHKLELEKQQRDLLQQETILQQKIARQQEHLLYKEQEDKEWREVKQEELAQSDAAIKKLEKEADFAESERLKGQKKQLAHEIAEQRTQNEVELKKQQNQLAQHQQELARLKNEQEKGVADIAAKENEQQQIVDALVTKSMQLRASNDMKALRREAAQLKAYITQIKTSPLKESTSFMRALQVPLESIEHRMAYLEKRAAEVFNKKISHIKKNIVAVRFPEELHNISMAIGELKKEIGSSMLLQQRQSDLYNRIRSELESLLMQKDLSEATVEPIAVVASKDIVQEEQEMPVQEVLPEPISNESEAKQPPVAIVPPIEKSITVSLKPEARSIAGFVLDKMGQNFVPIEYRNVLITTDNNGKVTGISYNNKVIQLIFDPLMARENSSNWIAAEIYAHQIGNDQKRIAQLLERARAHYMQQAGYDPKEARHNAKLFDFLRAGLIPVLEAKSNK